MDRRIDFVLIDKSAEIPLNTTGTFDAMETGSPTGISGVIFVNFTAEPRRFSQKTADLLANQFLVRVKQHGAVVTDQGGIAGVGQRNRGERLFYGLQGNITTDNTLVSPTFDRCQRGNDGASSARVHVGFGERR